MLLIFSLFWGQHTNAQKVEDATYFARFITAQKYRLGEGLPKDTVKSFALYNDCAENGNMSAAMIQVGLMHKKGYGTPKNPSKAFHWFSKSADKGDPLGMTQLGVMYKEGEGVEQDFEKAFEYFKASAEKDHPTGMYGVGYCSYKGLGTTQSYTEAVKWLKKGDEKNSAACAFLLGLCYRNGYGVDKNQEKGIDLLQKASDKGHKIAEQELGKRFPEIDRNQKEKEGSEDSEGSEGNNNENNSAQEKKFKKLLKHDNNVSLDGTWSGIAYFYDWSKQHILGEDSLIVVLKETGNHLKGELVENDEVKLKLKGIVVDGQILFNESRFTGKNRYGKTFPMDFKLARFEAIDADVNYLAGNIESYSPDANEPGRPCYVVLTKVVQEKSGKVDSVIVENVTESEIKETTSVLKETVSEIKVANTMEKEALSYFKEKDAMFTAFPNPFKNRINISYKIIAESEVAIYIYNSVGNLVIQKSLGIKQKGNYTKEIHLDAAPGQYIARLVVGSEAYAQIIIKQ